MHTKLIIFAIVSAVVCKDVSIGSPKGRKIFDEIRQANPAIWRQIENVTIIAPGDEVISGVIVTDKRPEKDGDAQIVDGGEGQNSVTIEIKSPTVLRGYEFQIEVYAEPGTKYTDAEEAINVDDKTLPDNSESTIREKNGSGDSEILENQDEVTTETPESSEKDVPAKIGMDTNDSTRQVRKTNDGDIHKSTEVDDMVNIPPEVDSSTTEHTETDKTTETIIKTEEVTSAPVMFENSKDIVNYSALDILDQIKEREGTRRIRQNNDEMTTEASSEESSENEPSTTELNESKTAVTTEAPKTYNDDTIDLLPPELGAPFNTDFEDASNTRSGRGLSIIETSKDDSTETTTIHEENDVTTTEASSEQSRNVRHTENLDSNSDSSEKSKENDVTCNSGLSSNNPINVIVLNGETLSSESKLRFDLPIVLILGNENNLPSVKIIVEQNEKPDLSIPEMSLGNLGLDEKNLENADPLPLDYETKPEVLPEN